ncbi:M20 family metallopeptidase [Arthrobacter sp. I2-34]|uniref:M20 family metallopeptidase n=1 Tax=Arthrobacter hankyongi TaxID=2904801 RepID=A0ABS9L487_9MICC|nr:M20 family metallopeptidase [Arthrobacter hankyongi]MCG2621484.1 M20 family metallopeptidase [Arthrobacter hankyongi]
MGWSASGLLDELIAALEPELAAAVGLRRELHRNPCLSGYEGPAAALLAAELGMPVQPLAGTGFITRVGPPAGPAVGLRAELDALPIHETTGVPWAAVNGAMHACGHDVHQAALVAFTRAAAAVPIPVALAPIAQPREEIAASGASEIVAGGVLEAAGIEAVLGVHVHPGLPAGSVSITGGAVNASNDEFEITVRGRGGHGAYPHTALDPVPVAARIALALYDLVRSHVNPLEAATLSIGQLEAGSAANVIPDTARLRGTVRAMSIADQQRLHRGLRQSAHYLARAAGARAEVRITHGEPVLVNDPALAGHTSAWLARAGLQLVPPLRTCGSDDFAFYTQRVSGLMAFLGVGGPADEDPPALHSSSFLPSDDAVEHAARAMAALYVGAACQLGAVTEP